MNDKPLTPEDIIAIEAAVAEVMKPDASRDLTVAQSFALGFACTEVIRRVGIYMMQQQFPEFTEVEAQRHYLAWYYSLKETVDVAQWMADMPVIEPHK
jgi:hypothetical protein